VGRPLHDPQMQRDPGDLARGQPGVAGHEGGDRIPVPRPDGRREEERRQDGDPAGQPFQDRLKARPTRVSMARSPFTMKPKGLSERPPG
jgi:hypothetical protein